MTLSVHTGEFFFNVLYYDLYGNNIYIYMLNFDRTFHDRTFYVHTTNSMLIIATFTSSTLIGLSMIRLSM